MPAAQREVFCPYCGLNAELMDSIVVYRKSYGMIWICQPCQAWVGVHKTSKSNRPKGTLAKAELRLLRQQVHAVFDPLWEAKVKAGTSKKKARRGLYENLAVALQIDYDDCHIGMFDENRCQEALSIVRTWERAAAEAAALEEPNS